MFIDIDMMFRFAVIVAVAAICFKLLTEKGTAFERVFGNSSEHRHTDIDPDFMSRAGAGLERWDLTEEGGEVSPYQTASRMIGFMPPEGIPAGLLPRPGEDDESFPSYKSAYPNATLPLIEPENAPKLGSSVFSGWETVREATRLNEEMQLLWRSNLSSTVKLRLLQRLKSEMTGLLKRLGREVSYLRSQDVVQNCGSYLAALNLVLIGLQGSHRTTDGAVDF